LVLSLYGPAQDPEWSNLEIAPEQQLAPISDFASGRGCEP
jgi:hypothetical protein